MQNTNSSLDPQSPIYTFAQFTTEEHEEYQRYLDAQQVRHDAENFDDSADDAPDDDAHMYPADAPADEGHMYPDDGDYDPSGDGDF
jgi:hypothetical protein